MRAAQAGGKRVIALLRGDDAGLREYLVAAGAGEIVANPDTMLTMLGVATGGVFLKNALDKLKIQAQTLQWKEYKGAAETLGRDTMSPAVRESMEAIVADWEKILVEAIASARKLSPEKARELIAAGFVSAKFAVENHLIDREGYIEDIRAEFDPESKRKVFVSLARYRRHAIFTRERGQRARIALVHASGPVVSGEAPPTGEYISGVATAAQIDRASRDERVKAIVFRVNSPGGSAVGSDLVWRAVREAQGRGKPVVVSMGDVAGSGGYYVAAGADAIVAEPATITGSIGVVYAKFNLGSLLTELGVHFDFVKSAPISDAMSFARAMTDAELAQLNDTVGHLYSAFTAKVARGPASQSRAGGSRRQGTHLERSRGEGARPHRRSRRPLDCDRNRARSRTHRRGSTPSTRDLSRRATMAGFSRQQYGSHRHRGQFAPPPPRSASQPAGRPRCSSC